jgi:hypothetical protein
MKKFVYLAFVGVLALAIGCATDSYPVITDTEGDSFMTPVATAGDVQQVPTSQVITLWPDGNDELFAHLDQDNQGGNWVRKITNHVNTSYGGTYFLDFDFCNLVASNCSIYNSFDDNGAFFDDRVFKPNCDGYRSLSLIVAFGSRFQECGDSVVDRVGLDTVSDWAGSATPGANGTYNINLNRRNFRLEGTDDLGNSYRLPFVGSSQIQYHPGKGVVVRYTQNLAPTVLAATRLSNDQGVTQWNLTYLGHTISVDAEVLQAAAKRVMSY